jgi:hypothetical protein
MKTPFEIFFRAIGVYALFTIPVLGSPIIYVISMAYVLSFGWFAWALFTIISFTSVNATRLYRARLFFLIVGVPVSVAFSFQMTGVFTADKNVWHSGVFLAFPMAGTISGWISLFFSAKRYRYTEPEELNRIAENTTL